MVLEAEESWFNSRYAQDLFFSLQNVQTDAVPHPALYSMVTEALSQRVK